MIPNQQPILVQRPRFDNPVDGMVFYRDVVEELIDYCDQQARESMEWVAVLEAKPHPEHEALVRLIHEVDFYEEMAGRIVERLKR